VCPSHPKLVKFSNLNGLSCWFNAAVVCIMDVMKKRNVLHPNLVLNPTPDESFGAILSAWALCGRNLEVDPRILMQVCNI
jgi:hypothetical protein